MGGGGGILYEQQVFIKQLFNTNRMKADQISNNLLINNKLRNRHHM